MIKAILLDWGNTRSEEAENGLGPLRHATLSLASARNPLSLQGDRVIRQATPKWASRVPLECRIHRERCRDEGTPC